MSEFYNQYQKQIDHFILSALKEDIEDGDHTSLACLNNNENGKAQLVAKERGIIAGVELAKIIFKKVNPAIDVSVLVQDGQPIKEGDTILILKGPQYDLLSTERLVLNCMQRMSGIASLTHRINKKINHTNCQLLDTRKTTPNFRYPEKWAVKIGGGINHRMGLFDTLMIKDNHVDFNGSIAAALKKIKQYLEKNQLDLPTIVEVRNFEEIEACFAFPWIHRLLLDNMSPAMMKKAVQIINGRFPTEASGNITEEKIIDIAESGVDYASLGALTHSAKNIDLSLKSI